MHSTRNVAEKLSGLEAQFAASLRRLEELDVLAREAKADPVHCITALKQSVPVGAMDIDVHQCGLERSARMRRMSPVITKLKEERQELLASRASSSSSRGRPQSSSSHQSDDSNAVVAVAAPSQSMANGRPPSTPTALSHAPFGDVSIIDTNASITATPTHLLPSRAGQPAQQQQTQHKGSISSVGTLIQSQSSGDVMRAIAIAAAGGKRVYLHDANDAYYGNIATDTNGDRRVSFDRPATTTHQSAGGGGGGISNSTAISSRINSGGSSSSNGGINSRSNSRGGSDNNNGQRQQWLSHVMQQYKQDAPERSAFENRATATTNVITTTAFRPPPPPQQPPAADGHNVTSIPAPNDAVHKSSTTTTTQRRAPTAAATAPVPAPRRPLLSPSERAERARANRNAAAASAAGGAIKSLRKAKPDSPEGYYM